eukprot:3191421-Rhodomonas_salina.1
MSTDSVACRCTSCTRSSAPPAPPPSEPLTPEPPSNTLASLYCCPRTPAVALIPELHGERWLHKAHRLCVLLLVSAAQHLRPRLRKALSRVDAGCDLPHAFSQSMASALCSV